MLPLGGRSETIFIVTTVFLGISFIAVCLRCFVRIKIVRAFGWDDALMVFAMVHGPSPPLRACFLLTTPQFLNILFALCGITGSLYGIGQKSAVLLERGTMETAMFVRSPRSDLHDPLRAIIRN